MFASAALLACAPAEPASEPASQAEGAGASVPAERPAANTEPDDGARGPRVVFLGTSLTAGLGLLRQEDTYVRRLQDMAAEADLPIQAVNAGVSGDTSAGGLRRLNWILREPLDILVVELGANDGLRGQDPDATAANLEQIVATVHERYPQAQVFLASMEAPPNLGDSYTQRFRDIFPRVARESGAHLVPFILDGIAGVPELNQADGIHPTPQGHRMMAENIWPSLEPAVAAWWSEHTDRRTGS